MHTSSHMRDGDNTLLSAILLDTRNLTQFRDSIPKKLRSLNFHCQALPSLDNLADVVNCRESLNPAEQASLRTQIEMQFSKAGEDFMRLFLKATLNISDNRIIVLEQTGGERGSTLIPIECDGIEMRSHKVHRIFEIKSCATDTSSSRGRLKHRAVRQLRDRLTLLRPVSPESSGFAILAVPSTSRAATPFDRIDSLLNGSPQPGKEEIVCATIRLDRNTIEFAARSNPNVACNMNAPLADAERALKLRSYIVSA